MAYVRPYTRSDGVRVRGHYRSNPKPKGGSGVGEAMMAAIFIVIVLAAIIQHGA